MSLPPALPTPGQTVGPFFHDSLPWPGDRDLVDAAHPGAVVLSGTVRDGAGEPVPDALVELWQADAEGRVVQQPGSLRRDGRTFTGFGRCATDADGGYAFTTLLPGPHADGAACFFTLCLHARGLLHRLLTRAYPPPGHGNTAAALAGDRLLAGLDERRRATLVCDPEPDGLRLDLVLQGSERGSGEGHRETVWLTYPRLPAGG